MSGYQQYVGRSNDLIANVNSGEIGGSRNVVIGGDFGTNPWQRGTVFVSAGAGLYTADRWAWNASGVGIVDVAQNSGGPTVAQAGRVVTHNMTIDVTTADVAIAAGDNYFIQTKIEGFDFQRIAQRVAVLSFWHAHTKTGTYCIALRNSGADRSFVAEYAQSVSDTWEYTEIMIPASPSAGTWNYGNGVGVHLGFVLACGSTFQTTPNAWNNGNFIATANQVNGMDSTSNFFRLALVQLEPGMIATPFNALPMGTVINLCQRYYSKSFHITQAPIQNAGFGSGHSTLKATLTGAVSDYWGGIKFKTSMRGVPNAVTLYNVSAANAQVRNVPDATDCSASTSTGFTSEGFDITFTGNAGMSVGDILAVHWAADCEL